MNCKEAKAQVEINKQARKADRRRQRECGGWFNRHHAYRRISTVYGPTDWWYECICCGFKPFNSPLEVQIVETHDS